MAPHPEGIKLSSQAMQEFSVPGEEQGFSLLWFQDEGSEGRQCHHMSLLSSLPHLRFLESSSDFPALQWLGIKYSAFTWDLWCFWAVLLPGFPWTLSKVTHLCFVLWKKGMCCSWCSFSPAKTCLNSCLALSGSLHSLHQAARTLVFIQNSWVHVKHCQKRTFLVFS